MGKLKEILVPSCEIKQGDDSQDIHGLHGHTATEYAQQFELPRCRIGKHGGKQDEAGFDAVAACLHRDAYTAPCVQQDLAVRHGIGVEGAQEKGGDPGE